MAREYKGWIPRIKAAKMLGISTKTFDRRKSAWGISVMADPINNRTLYSERELSQFLKPKEVSELTK